MKKFVINIRASKNISGLVKVTVTSPAGLVQFFLNVEPCGLTREVFGKHISPSDAAPHAYTYL